MANIQLTTVIRKGFEFPEGLLAAQSAHIGDEWLRSRILESHQENTPMKDSFSKEELDWMETPYIAVLSVNTLEELVMVRDDARKNELQFYEWHDVIPCPSIEGRSMKAFVGISIGPTDSDKIKLVTHGLKLYKQ